MNLRLVKAVAKWRAQFNPLRGLSFQRGVSLLEEGERGAYADVQWLFRSIEKRDPTLRALKRLRLAAISKLDWDIKLVDQAAEAAAKKQADALRAAYERIDNLKAAIAFLALAEFRGYAHLEKWYQDDDPAAEVTHLEPVPQWHWCRDTLYGPWLYNADAASTTRGQEIELRHFLIRDVDDPIDEIGLLCYLRKNLSQKDWDGFVEVYGIPPLFAIMPQTVPAGKESEYQEMAEAVVSDMRGTLPNGADIKTVDAGARGMNPFRDHLTYQDEQLVLAGTSGKLTMLNGPTGLGSGQSETHQETFDELAQAEAAEISEIFQKQFDRAVLDAAGFEGKPALAYFELAAQNKTDVGQVLDHAVKITQAGGRVDFAELSEKTGYKITAGPLPGSQPSALNTQPAGALRATFNRASPLSPDDQALRTAALQQLATALEKDLAPLRAAVEDALAQDDPKQLEDALAQVKAQLPAMLKRTGADSETAKAFEQILGTALVDGAATARQAITRNRSRLAGPLAWLRTLFSLR
jgi:phage gp29-like protein